MARLIILTLVIVIAVMLWRRLSRRFADGKSQESLSTDLVRCIQCDMHVARESAISTDNGWRCRDHKRNSVP